ncbi:MAG: adenylyltransferase/cytidyltransferase family protein [Candidatus Pacebacteria bacterium]|nr:adenylyltransferase/cytidyltransferase family protein [Candidatus Paceibacterota bacterium]
MKIRKCKKCGKEFIPNTSNQIYCGSKTKRKGCSWGNVNIDRSKRRWKKDKRYRAYQKEYQKKWMKEQRGLNTDYAERQRERKRNYYKGEKGKSEAARWRKRNIKKILEWNRRRLLQKKGILGFHRNVEWEELKKNYDYSCAECGISEKELAIIWKGTSFVKLTKDHVIPVTKGGTDFINNIQPLCVSCNARKHNQIMKKEKEIIVATSGYFNPVHVGHVRLFDAAKKLGTKLVVIVNNDEQVKLKGSIPFMNEKERMEIVSSFAPIDNIILAVDKDKTVCETLKLIKPDIFAKGGDRTKDNVPEMEVCREIGCKVVFGVGDGGKIQSSSWLINNALKSIYGNEKK